MDVSHVLTMRPTAKMDTPTGLVRGDCSCLLWLTKLGSPRNVAAAWYEHQAARARLREENLRKRLRDQGDGGPLADRPAETPVEPTPLSGPARLDDQVPATDPAAPQDPPAMYTKDELDDAVAVALGRVRKHLDDSRLTSGVWSLTLACQDLGLRIEDPS